MIATEDAILAAINAIESAGSTSGTISTQLEAARWLHREAQLRWDFIAAENSMGFHNPEGALRILVAATNLARQAELKAVQAAGTPDVLQPETN